MRSLRWRCRVRVLRRRFLTVENGRQVELRDARGEVTLVLDSISERCQVQRRFQERVAAHGENLTIDITKSIWTFFPTDEMHVKFVYLTHSTCDVNMRSGHYASVHPSKRHAIHTVH